MSYDMFTKAGNNACQALVNRISKTIKGARRITAAELQVLYDRGRDKIAEKYGEVFDTEPRVELARAINKTLEETGYSFRIGYFGDVE